MRRSWPRRSRLGSVVVVLLLVFGMGACGGKDDEPTGSAPEVRTGGDPMPGGDGSDHSGGARGNGEAGEDGGNDLPEPEPNVRTERPEPTLPPPTIGSDKDDSLTGP